MGLQPFSFKAGRVELNRQEILAYCRAIPVDVGVVTVCPPVNNRPLECSWKT